MILGVLRKKPHAHVIETQGDTGIYFLLRKHCVIWNRACPSAVRKKNEVAAKRPAASVSILHFDMQEVL